MSEHADKFMEFLPQRIREMAQVIPVAAAITIAERWPGVPLYFPAAPGPEHPISLAIGREHALSICKIYAGETVVMPRLGRYWQAHRDAAICAALDSGEASGADLALKYGLRSDTVYAIYARYKRAQQGDLFDSSREQHS